MNSVVSNATPLIYLAKIGRINLLKGVFGGALIPEEVKVEVVDQGKERGERDAPLVEKAIREGWLRVLRTERIEIPIKLEVGELAVLSLAKAQGVREVLVDEASARMAARLLDLTPRGTVFILLKALEKGEIDLEEFLHILDELVKQGFRLKEEVFIEAIREARKIAREAERSL